MRYFALATDYDGTLATDGRVDGATLEAVRRLKASGRRALLVTGRRIDDLERIFPEHAIFDRIVVENGAVLYDPTDKTLRLLEEPPPAELVERLRRRGVAPLDVGHVILATWQPHERVILDVIREMGLELHLEFNKGAVMVMPAGVTKRTGLHAALVELQLSAHNVVGVGDAENDHAFLAACECGVAVQNALPSLKDRADWVTDQSEGKGVTELIDRVIADDLASLRGPSERHALSVGRQPDGSPVHVDPHAATILVAGPSGSGKSTLATTLVERLLQDLGYQLCVVDPEGDHERLEPLAPVGDTERAPTVDEIEALLRDPRRSAVASLLAVPLEERPRWFAVLRGRIHELRRQSGRPHWLVVDEAHHVMPAKSDAPLAQLPKNSAGILLVTVNPESLARAALDEVTLLITTPQGAAASLRAFAAATDREAPELPDLSAVPNEGVAAVVWRVHERGALLVEVPPPRHEHQRHKRKYATGDLGQDRSFVFRGPKGELRLRAQNLALFSQIASGVDEGTWLYHLRAGDYSLWFREAIKDPSLADEAAVVEKDAALTATESRDRILAVIKKRYMLRA
jgi:hypothetical protein